MTAGLIALVFIAGCVLGALAAQYASARCELSTAQAWEGNYRAECRRHDATQHELARAYALNDLAAANVVRLSCALGDATGRSLSA